MTTLEKLDALIRAGYSPVFRLSGSGLVVCEYFAKPFKLARTGNYASTLESAIDSAYDALMGKEEDA